MATHADDTLRQDMARVQSAILSASSRQLAGVLRVVEFFAVLRADLEPPLQRAAILLIERADPNHAQTLAEFKALQDQLDEEYRNISENLPAGRAIPARAEDTYFRAAAVQAIVLAAQAESPKEVRFAVHTLFASASDEDEQRRVVDELLKALQ